MCMCMWGVVAVWYVHVRVGRRCVWVCVCRRSGGVRHQQWEEESVGRMGMKPARPTFSKGLGFGAGPSLGRRRMATRTQRACFRQGQDCIIHTSAWAGSIISLLSANTAANLAQVEVFFQTSPVSGLGSRIQEPCGWGPDSSPCPGDSQPSRSSPVCVEVSAWGGPGLGCGGRGEAKAPHYGSCPRSPTKLFKAL